MHRRGEKDATEVIDAMDDDGRLEPAGAPRDDRARAEQEEVRGEEERVGRAVDERKEDSRADDPEDKPGKGTLGPAAEDTEHEPANTVFLASGGKRAQEHANEKKGHEVNGRPCDHGGGCEVVDRHSDQDEGSKGEQGPPQDGESEVRRDGVERLCRYAVENPLDKHAVRNQGDETQHADRRADRRRRWQPELPVKQLCDLGAQDSEADQTDCEEHNGEDATGDTAFFAD